MKRNNIRNVIVHIGNDADTHALADKISEFHASLIERKLNSLNLTTEQKIAIIDKIIDDLKSREVAGIIK